MTKTEILDAYSIPGEPRQRAVERVADALRIKPQAVHQWPERLVGPRLYAIQCVIEKRSGGNLSASEADNVTLDEARVLRATGAAPRLAAGDGAPASESPREAANVA